MLTGATPSAGSPCAFMAVLIELLGEFPGERDRKRAETASERLDKLEYEARWHGAPETTLAAIQGARVLLSLADLPPLPRPSVQHGVVRP